MAQAGLLGDAKEHLVLLLRRFKLFIPFVFRLLVLFHSLRPISHRSSQSILDGTVGACESAFLGTMRHIIFLRYYLLLAKHTILLGTFIIRRLSMGTFVGEHGTSPSLLLPRYPDRYVAVI